MLHYVYIFLLFCELDINNRNYLSNIRNGVADLAVGRDVFLNGPNISGADFIAYRSEIFKECSCSFLPCRSTMSDEEEDYMSDAFLSKM